MYSRFTNDINGFKSLGKTYANVDLVNTIPKCLLKSWEPKQTAIQEAKELKTLHLINYLDLSLAMRWSLGKIKNKRGRHCFESNNGTRRRDWRCWHVVTHKRFLNKKVNGKTCESRNAEGGDMVWFNCRKPGQVHQIKFKKKKR